jgi:lipopolysaccharide export system protein LptA
MPHNHKIATVFLLSIVMCGASVAYAEKADRSKPVNLDADKVVYDDAKKTSLFEGKVVLTQGSIRIQADKILVKQDKNGFSYATANGSPVSFKQKLEGSSDFIEGYGERLEFDSKSDTVQLFDRAFIKRGQDELRGNYISYNSRSEVFKVEGGSPAASATTTPGRVHVIIQPKNIEPEDAPTTPKQ